MQNEQQELRELTRGLTADEAIARLTEYIAEHPESDEALTMRGMRYWGLSRRADAINDYLAAIRLNPESRAVQALKATNEILDFYNKDLFNP
ncbi:MAG: hypothetical protein HDS67_03985 [Bacteroidales bacterium]|nr:hypothetical protein [Bacteroidales bacterium]